jgi:hypothetical protein
MNASRGLSVRAGAVLLASIVGSSVFQSVDLLAATDDCDPSALQEKGSASYPSKYFVYGELFLIQVEFLDAHSCSTFLASSNPKDGLCYMGTGATSGVLWPVEYKKPVDSNPKACHVWVRATKGWRETGTGRVVVTSDDRLPGEQRPRIGQIKTNELKSLTQMTKRPSPPVPRK